MSAIAVVAMMAAVFGCATRGQDSGTRSAADTARDSAPASAGSTARPGAQLQEAAFNEDSDGARLVLSADAPLVYTAYEPRPDLLVVDLPGSGLSEKFALPAASGSIVTSVRVEPITEMGKSMTRVTVAHRDSAHYDVRTVGLGLAVTFDAAPDASSSAAVGIAETVPAAPLPARASQAAPAAASTVSVEKLDVPASSAARAAPRGEVAHVLEEVRVAASAKEVTVSLLGDGTFAPRDFNLDNPPRLVIDLPGVTNEVKRRVLPVKSGLVTRVRISQFQTAPDLVTRVVLDLSRPMAHSVRTDGERLAVVVGTDSSPAIASAAPSRTTIAAEKAAASEPAPSDIKPADTPSTSLAAVAAPPAGQSVSPVPAPAPDKAAEPPAQVVEKTPPPAPPAVRVAEKPVPEPKPSAPAVKTPASSTVADSSVSSAPAAAPAPVRKSAPEAPAKPRAPGKGTAREEALFEAAAAMLAQEDATHPVQSSARFQPRTISETQSQFTGEPISLHLKDADIRDVFRTISELTQLNLVVDPEVRGTVTVDLEDVPWDQALDLILKQNGLGYVFENNIMRIATSAKLQAEQTDRSRLAEARQAAEATRTVIKKLSYARAAEITSSIKSVMSRRGDIVIDARTNTLIIREIPTFMPAVLQLIDNLDTATPQVMIEARIVETTKSLGRSLGINWGVNGSADVAHGNTTGLIFPNTVDFGGTGAANRGFRVALDAGPPVIGFGLGNILNTFNLDMAVSAAENQGLLKIISSPKVAALTNTSASIQSGVQIPVQTNVNNTTTVIYVDATLRLQVTPQITNEGTILLQVNVQKREPAVALNLALGQNVPLTVRQYTGEVLVRDGGTAVIGGIFQINDQDQNNMIPGIWKIPILGNLFRNKTRTEKHDELLIFITPRIIRS